MLDLAASKEVIIREATARYPTSKNRPTAMSRVIDKKRGIYCMGGSGNVAQEIHPKLKARMPVESLESWDIENCAEFQAVNVALFDGADWRDLVGSTTKTKEPNARCANCQVTLKGIYFSTD